MTRRTLRLPIFYVHCPAHRPRHVRASLFSLSSSLPATAKTRTKPLAAPANVRLVDHPSVVVCTVCRSCSRGPLIPVRFDSVSWQSGTPFRSCTVSPLSDGGARSNVVGQVDGHWLKKSGGEGGLDRCRKRTVVLGWDR